MVDRRAESGPARDIAGRTLDNLKAVLAVVLILILLVFALVPGRVWGSLVSLFFN